MIYKRNIKLILSVLLPFVFSSAFGQQTHIVSITEIEKQVTQARSQKETLGQLNTQGGLDSTEPLYNFPLSVIDNLKEELKQEALQGYIKKNDNIDTAWFGQLAITAYYNFEKKVSKIKPGLAFIPTVVSSINNRGYRLLGAHSDGVLTDDGWTGLIRVFRHKKNKKILLLEENHYDRLMSDLYSDTFSEDAREAKRQNPHIQIRERLNTDVNGFPATLRSVESQDGTAISSLSWDNNGILYHITVGGNAGKKLFKRKADLAKTATTEMGTSYDLNDARKIKQDAELGFLTIAKEIAY